MTASLQIKKDRPNYYVVLAYKDEMTNKNKTKWISTDIPIKGNNKRLANEKMKEVLAEYESLGVDLGKDILFVKFMELWLTSLKSSIKESTYDSYKYALDNQIIPFFEHKKLKVKDLTPAHIQQYSNHKLKSVSPNTVLKHLVYLSKCLDSGVKQNLIAFNPVKRIEKPKKVKYRGAKFYNEIQIKNLLEKSKGDPLELIILLTTFYGLRRSEVLGLRWENVNFDNNIISIEHTVVIGKKKLVKEDSTKNESSRRILPMPKIIYDTLKCERKKQLSYKLLQPNDYIDDGYVCVKKDGTLILPNYISQHFKILLKKHNLPDIRFHDLRHSAACYLLSLGFTMKEVSEFLGHSDIQTTMNFYAHIDIEAKQDMTDKLNERFNAMMVSL